MVVNKRNYLFQHSGKTVDDQLIERENISLQLGVFLRYAKRELQQHAIFTSLAEFKDNAKLKYNVNVPLFKKKMNNPPPSHILVKFLNP